LGILVSQFQIGDEIVDSIIVDSEFAAYMTQSKGKVKALTFLFVKPLSLCCSAATSAPRPPSAADARYALFEVWSLLENDVLPQGPTVLME
jgi:hypothetical protein